MPESAQDFNPNPSVYSVSEVSAAIKRAVEDRFGVIRLRGELSGYKAASSGHVYFRLKDDSAVIDGVMWRGTATKLSFKPEDGMEVICAGKITTYEGRSSYQIIVNHMEPAGAGALMAILEKRKKQLAAEGLFDPARKKPLPFFPRTIGIITSPTGAVIRDILHRLTDRFPVHVLVWPVAVQGEGAAEQVAEAITGFNTLIPNPQCPIPDLLIVARGGGSIEDLWAFNEEIVVRAAAASNIPLISAVGHETDTTLIDYAADQRAPTPTAAAEMAVPVRAELQQTVGALEKRLQAVAQRLFENATQRVDDWSERLLAALPMMLERKAQQLAVLAARLQPRVLFSEVNAALDKLKDSGKRMTLAMQRRLEKYTQALAHLSALLESVNYQRVLERGFALVKNAEGKVVSSAATAKKEKALVLVFKDGELPLSNP